MFASLSAEARINEKIAKLNCTVAFIAALSGISNTRLSNALSGLKALPGRDGEDINQLCADLIEFCNAQAPIPVELRNPILIKRILDDWKIQKKKTAE
jgi:hypothetical protein